ncbi:hypothetical protein [Pseudothermotoga sp.]|nr:hypothetical protein [Pseudothermotoga sp.]MCX7812288.1 hypothetical protein [Pseudothermotoga sp.]MDW8139358.1 hypothetical protein [Pseudothermotoga sp.]
MLVLVCFAVGVFSCFPIIDKVIEYVEPLYVKCLTYSALRYVHGQNPSGVVTITVSNGEIKFRCVPSDRNKDVLTITMVPKGNVKLIAKDSTSIVLSPVAVLKAGSIVSDKWTVSFPPVVVKVNIKR